MTENEIVNGVEILPPHRELLRPIYWRYMHDHIGDVAVESTRLVPGRYDVPDLLFEVVGADRGPVTGFPRIPVFTPVPRTYLEPMIARVLDVGGVKAVERLRVRRYLTEEELVQSKPKIRKYL